MFEQAKKIIEKSKQRVLRGKASKDLTSDEVRKAREYVAEYWAKLERHHPKDDETLIGLPHPYLVPSFAEGHEFDYNEMYYWDTYFMAQGLLDDEHKELVIGMLDNLCHIFNRFGVIPNGSRLYYVSRSQPPFLTTFIFDLYDRYNLGEKWLKKHIDVAKKEYKTVWMGTVKPNARLVYEGLSRYYDFNYLHDIAETESGWDMTPRFHRKALHYLPADLNALLYKYETDFARAARLLGNKKEAEEWDAAAEKRKRAINRLMWDKVRGLYFDYNYAKERRGSVSSLAAYFPMWAGMVDKKRAARLVRELRKFERKGGLATTDDYALRQRLPGSLPMQWAYPNGWAPLQLIVVQALQRYGYHDDARRIANKWLHNNLRWFIAHGEFLEKYNVADPEKPPAKGVYPSQVGFGWTNAVFERFCQEYVDGQSPLPYNTPNH